MFYTSATTSCQQLHFLDKMLGCLHYSKLLCMSARVYAQWLIFNACHEFDNIFLLIFFEIDDQFVCFDQLCFWYVWVELCLINSYLHTPTFFVLKFTYVKYSHFHYLFINLFIIILHIALWTHWEWSQTTFADWKLSECSEHADSGQLMPGTETKRSLLRYQRSIKKLGYLWENRSLHHKL